MKKWAKGIGLLVLSLVLCCGFAMTTFAATPTEDELADLFSTVGFTMTVSG